MKPHTYAPCRHCEGRGEWHGFLTNDPSERAQWHTCFDCGGTGASRETTHKDKISGKRN